MNFAESIWSVISDKLYHKKNLKVLLALLVGFYGLKCANFILLTCYMRNLYKK